MNCNWQSSKGFTFISSFLFYVLFVLHAKQQYVLF
jgi:hypothetical protein